jgi:hypothetical protein
MTIEIGKNLADFLGNTAIVIGMVVAFYLVMKYIK